jgi:hypothetical protein
MRKITSSLETPGELTGERKVTSESLLVKMEVEYVASSHIMLDLKRIEIKYFL